MIMFLCTNSTFRNAFLIIWWPTETQMSELKGKLLSHWHEGSFLFDHSQPAQICSSVVAGAAEVFLTEARAAASPDLRQGALSANTSRPSSDFQDAQMGWKWMQRDGTLASADKHMFHAAFISYCCITCQTRQCWTYTGQVVMWRFRCWKCEDKLCNQVWRVADLLTLAALLNDLNIYVWIKPTQLNWRREDHADDRRLTGEVSWFKRSWADWLSPLWHVSSWWKHFLT